MLAVEPRSSEAVVIKGEALAKLGNADAALQQFQQALSIDPNSVSARWARANINLSRGDYAAVDNDVEPVLKAAPQHFGANYLRALENFKKRDFSGAGKILDRLSPNFANVAEGYYVLAATKYGLGQYEQAANAIAKYLARVPDNPFGPRLAAEIAVFV